MQAPWEPQSCGWSRVSWWPPSSSSLSSHGHLHEREWRGFVLRTNQDLKPEAALGGHLRPLLLLSSSLPSCAFQTARSLAGQSSSVLSRVCSLQSIQLSSKLLLWLLCHSSGACVCCLLRTVKSMGCIDTWITFCTAGKHPSGWQTEMNGTYRCCFTFSKSCVFWAKVRDTSIRMAWWVKVLVTKNGNPGSIPRVHLVEAENKLLHAVLGAPHPFYGTSTTSSWDG